MQNEISNTRSIIETGIMIAILVAIMLFPSLGLLLYIIAPTAVALIYVRNGAKYSVAAVSIALILGFVFIGLLNIIQIGPILPFVGIPLGYCIKNKKKPVKTIIYLSIGFFIVIFINIFIVPLFMYSNGAIGLVDYAVKSLNESLKTAKNIYLNAGISNDVINQMGTSTITSLDIFEVIPPLMILSAAFLGAISYKITELVFRRLNIPMEKRRNFTYFFAPNRMVAFLIIFTCIGLMLQAKNMIIGDYIYITGINIATVLLSLDAIAYIAYFLRQRFKMPKALIIIIILILITILNNSFILIGFIDTIFDFRKLDPNRIGKNKVNKYGK